MFQTLRAKKRTWLSDLGIMLLAISESILGINKKYLTVLIVLAVFQTLFACLLPYLIYCNSLTTTKLTEYVLFIIPIYMFRKSLKWINWLKVTELVISRAQIWRQEV